MTKLRTERDVVESLAGQAVTLAELYALCEEAGVATRDDGLAPIEGFGSDQKFKRRVRNALQGLRKAGRAERVAGCTWVIEGRRVLPRRCLLVICGEPSHLELVLADAAQLLGQLDEPADLVLADPPWALARQSSHEASFGAGRGERIYNRDSSMVVPGYVDVADNEYADFTAGWVEAAAGALRPGAYLSIITGPSGAARVQVAAEEAGLNFVNSIVARRPFALKTTRRFSHAHTVITIMCKGPVQSSRRFFATPASLPLSNSGTPYPLDFWADTPKPEERPGQLRYDNTLPELIPRRLVQALTRGPENGGRSWQDLVVDAFLGGGTGAYVCHEEQRRYIGGDRNLHSLRYVMARFNERLAAPSLFALS